MANFHLVQYRIFFACKAARLTWLTKPMVQHCLQKLNQMGKATNSLVQLPATMTPNDSQLLIWCQKLRWILCSWYYHYKTKSCCWMRLGSIELQFVLVPSGNSTDKLRTSNLVTEANKNQPATSIPPPRLNLSQGITGTLLDQIIQYRNCEDAQDWINLNQELARQQRPKERALRVIASNKRYTAGHHVVVGRYLLVPEVFNEQLVKRKRQPCKRSAEWARESENGREEGWNSKLLN